MNIALVTAGGIGRRVEREIPKQFLTVNEKPIIIYTLEVFQNHPLIDAIFVVCLSGYTTFLEDYCKQYSIDKLKGIVGGGKSGFESILNGLNEIKTHYSDADFVLIQEAVRPCINAEMITDSIQTAETYGGAVAALRSEDELLSVEGKILIDRDVFFIAQNPHTFKLGDLLWAYAEAERQNLKQSLGTAVLMSKLNKPFGFSAGDIRNIKITLPQDVVFFENICKARV